MPHITLQQPLGTDIYNISVFNTNFQTIEDVINSLQDLVGEFEGDLDGKYPLTYITSNTTNIDSGLQDGVYYLTVTPSGTLPSGVTGPNSMIFVSNINGDTSEFLYAPDGNIYHRYAGGDWKQLTVDIVDNLSSQERTAALSANQGYILNRDKVGIYFKNDNTGNNSINIDNITSGVYICDGTSVTGTLPDYMSISTTTPDTNNFILESYGTTGSTSAVQYLNDTKMDIQAVRFGYLNGSTWSWNTWNRVSFEGGDGGNAITLRWVDL